MSDEETTQPETTDAAPQEAFALIGNEVRAEIVRALGAEQSGHVVLPFSELRSRVATDVNSSKFNYHLQELVGQFVTKTEEGYKLRPEGLSLYRTIAAGSFTREASLAPFEVGLDCYFCDAPVEATYDDGQFLIRCSDCGHRYCHTMVPPSVVDDQQELLTRVANYTRYETLAVAGGVCPTCLNGVGTEFIPAGESPHHAGDQLDVLARRSCDHCGETHFMSLGVALLDHPELVTFCHERGLDVATTPIWDLEFASTDRSVTVRSRDPWEVALTLSLDGDRLELVVDGDLSVVATKYK
ncbi:winged helix-turn-helix domain-containing protein [Halorussus halophilus]|uniref:winged helix-turn-helix domain-containing protein n=1 Tax=Halorussus halophilus TaxID=2650975 RepID=UPI001301927F|nr:helix-turn-helix domain-containing protein [Halorussus halophilus]